MSIKTIDEEAEHYSFLWLRLQELECICKVQETRVEELVRMVDDLEVKIQAALDIMVEVDDWVESLGIYAFDYEEPVTVFKKLRKFLSEERED